MSGEFDVFDEWGSYVGKFTPAGGGWDGCLLAIAMLFLWTVGFLVYLLVKLVVQGFRAAGRKEWNKAVAYWAVPGLIVAWFVLSLASAVATQAAQERERRIQEERKAVFVSLARMGQLVEVERIRNASAEEAGCSSQCGFSFGKYEFINISGLDLVIQGGWSDCIVLEFSPARLGPNEQISTFCAEGNFPPHWGPPTVIVKLYGGGFPWAILGLDGEIYEILGD